MSESWEVARHPQSPHSWGQTATEGWAVRQDGHCEQRGASGGPEAGRNTVRFALSKEVDDSEEGVKGRDASGR